MQTTGMKIPDPNSDQFEQFARKVCQSPELAYLTIMAFAAKLSASLVVREKFDAARSRVQGHLDAIDSIIK